MRKPLLNMLRPSRPRDVNDWAWFFAPSALLLIPFLRFAKSNAYPILSPEILLIVLGILIIGMVFGLVGQLGSVVRAFLFAAALTLMIDVQSTFLFDYGLFQYIWLPVGLFVLILLGPEVVRTFSLVMVFVTLVAVLATPASRLMESREFDDDLVAESGPAAETVADSRWIHIILDEQIGIESIPIEFDPERRLADSLARSYVDNGFTVFGRAFTHFPQTHLSLATIFNLTKTHPRHYISASGGAIRTFSLTQSAYYDQLRYDGYRIHAYSMDYFGICNIRGGDGIRACNRYVATSIGGLTGSTLSVPQKMLLLLRIYARLSKVLMKFVTELDLDRRLNIPNSAAPVTSLKILARFRDDVVEGDPASAWILHIPLPHDPYALKRDCAIRSLPWPAKSRESVDYRTNTAEERRENYSLYLEQVDCTNRLVQSFFDELKAAGVYDNSHIVVHGDHGSRIATHNLRQRASYRPDFRPSAQTMVDIFGTLFAYKPPGSRTGQYRREIVSVTDLLGRALTGDLGDGEIADNNPVAYLVEWSDEACQKSTADDIRGCRLIPVPVPPFSNGRIGIETD